MAKAVQTNGMPVFMGRAPGLNQYDQIPNLAYLPKVVTKVADYTCLASESGTIFNTVGATDNVNFTLPAIGDGPWILEFIAGADVNLTVTAETTATIITFNDLTGISVAYSTSSEKIGGAFRVVCDGSNLFVIPLGAGGHLQTITIAT